ncbi:MAG: sugar kinase [Ruminococcaceae bacterium]|nr:sugar kinase [Oscillospiraceae bacterium]
MRITGFGDYLIHFSPVGEERFYQAETMKISFTGAEANVCAALALWGHDVSFVTRLPSNPLSFRSIAFLKGLGINTSHIANGGTRMGLYFLEKGASVRSSQVIYDRHHSGFTEATPADFDIDAILSNTDWLYLTGITPALSPSLYDCTLALCQEAKKRGIAVALDVNYRPALSTPAEAGRVLRTLAPYLTCLIGNEEHLKSLLDFTVPYGEDEIESRLRAITDETRKRLDVPNIAVTVRRTPSASDAVIYASYSNGQDFAVSPVHRMHVVDRVGSGDAFSAGLLHAIGEGRSVAETVNFAAASNAIKHTVISDINFATVDEITRVMAQAYDVKR